MKIEVDLPDELIAGLRDRSKERGLSLDAYTAELVHQILAHEALGDQAKIENRPEWEMALERSRADLAAGRIVLHDEVRRWHQSQPESSGQKKR